MRICVLRDSARPCSSFSNRWLSSGFIVSDSISISLSRLTLRSMCMSLSPLSIKGSKLHGGNEGIDPRSSASGCWRRDVSVISMECICPMMDCVGAASQWSGALDACISIDCRKRCTWTMLVLFLISGSLESHHSGGGCQWCLCHLLS